SVLTDHRTMALYVGNPMLRSRELHHSTGRNRELAAKVRSLRPQHARSKDIMIAAQAHSLGIPLMTRNAKDFELVSDVVEILGVS
ncbi:hypothetical protein, partial [Pseudarthrobacter oxydans]|uniref:hypothetical protein n=1 Tax=Pseudarthrobacter oxydans TaxID=1671 RepID=UPI0034504B07